MAPRTIHLAAALEGAGWHPSAWREPGATPDQLFTGAYWARVVQEAERGLLDLVTIEDTLSLQTASALQGPDDATDEVRGRLDAVLVATHVAPLTSSIGLVPVATTTHTEPFHVSKAIATLDHISLGRGGVQARVSATASEARLFGRREIPELSGIEDPRAPELIGELFDEAAAVVDTVRALWDSWEDDAEIRDVATDRFLDAAKVHRVDVETPWFSVRGPATVPRPPQGQPVVAALAHSDVPYAFAAGSADLVVVTPADTEDARRILDRVREQERAADRSGEPLRVLADLVVLLDSPEESGADRLERLDRLGRPLASDARVVTGSAAQLADEIEALAELGYDGVRLRPGVLAADLPRITVDLVPELQRRGLFRTRYEETTLRGLLGLPTEVTNRFTTIHDEARSA